MDIPKGFNSKNEYLDYLYYWEKDPGNKSFDSYKDQIMEILNAIYKRFGEKMPSTRLCYILMKFYNLKKYEAQRLIRHGMNHNFIKHADNLWVIIKS